MRVLASGDPASLLPRKMHLIWLGLRPVISGAACVRRSLITLIRTFSLNSVSSGATLIMVGADSGMRCCASAMGCKSRTFCSKSSVMSSLGDPARAFSALDRSQLCIRSDTRCSILFCCLSTECVGIPLRCFGDDSSISSSKAWTVPDRSNLARRATPLVEESTKRGAMRNSFRNAFAFDSVIGSLTPPKAYASMPSNSKAMTDDHILTDA